MFQELQFSFLFFLFHVALALHEKKKAGEGSPIVPIKSWDPFLAIKIFFEGTGTAARNAFSEEGHEISFTVLASSSTSRVVEDAFISTTRSNYVYFRKGRLEGLGRSMSRELNHPSITLRACSSGHFLP
jgi:hypothetical protein